MTKSIQTILILWGCFLLISKPVQAQFMKSDTLFYHQGKQVTDPGEADAFKIVLYFDSLNALAYERIFSIDGILIEELHYSNYAKDEINLFHKIWYGYKQPFKVMMFDHGKLHGDYLIYFPNRVLMRHEKYEQGKLIAGKCYDTTGAEIRYYPLNGDAFFLGGDQDFRARLNSKLAREFSGPARDEGGRKLNDQYLSGKVDVSFMVTKSGVVRDVKVLSSPKPDMNDKVVNAITQLRGWFPATRDGEMIDSVIRTSIVIWDN